MNKETAASDTGSIVKKSDSLKKVLDELKNEVKEIRKEIIIYKTKLKRLEERLFGLIDNQFGPSGEISRIEIQLLAALREESDEVATVVVWKAKPRWFCDGKYVVRKVTKNRIYVASVGDLLTTQYQLDGKSVSKNYGEIDIEATFGKAFFDKKSGLTA